MQCNVLDIFRKLKRENRPSEIRFTGVPPIMAIIRTNLNIEVFVNKLNLRQVFVDIRETKMASFFKQ